MQRVITRIGERKISLGSQEDFAFYNIKARNLLLILIAQAFLLIKNKVNEYLITQKGILCHYYQATQVIIEGEHKQKDSPFAIWINLLDRLSLSIHFHTWTSPSTSSWWGRIKNRMCAEINEGIKYACVTVESFHCGLRVEISILICFFFGLKFV